MTAKRTTAEASLGEISTAITPTHHQTLEQGRLKFPQSPLLIKAEKSNSKAAAKMMYE